MDCRLTVIAHNDAMTWNLDEWTVLVVLTALSAQPETLGQVAEAIRRYMPDHSLLEQGTSLMGKRPAPSDGPWCLVDMISRTVVAGDGFELPDPDGAYQADETDHVDGFPIIWLDTPSDWRFLQVETGTEWRDPVRQRAEEAARKTPLDARPIFFGRPMLAFLAKSVLAVPRDEAPRDDGIVENERQLERTRAIHAEWLMTPRGDLERRTPREILLSDRMRITREVERRSQQWSRQRQAPPSLATDTAAYRFGLFGMSEVVLHFDLIRALLDHAWTLVERQPDLSPEVLIERLADHRDHWLASPQEDAGTTLAPAEQIELERRRMPVTGDHSPIDCDCPLCLEMASGQFGPSFMWFDGHHLEMEDEFAFSLTESREEWERDQADWQDLSEKMDTEETNRSAPDTDAEEAADEAVEEADRSAWQSSYVDWEMLSDSDTPPGVAKMAIGFLLAELIAMLKEQTDQREHLEALNQAYLCFRGAEDSIATHSAAEELRDQLEQAAKAYPQLVSKSADLQSRLDEVLRITAAATSH